MLVQYKTKTNLFIGVGILLQIAAVVFLVGALAAVVKLVSAILFIIGCCYYAKAKGHNAAWGLLGLLSIIGLLILVFFTDRNK